VVILAEMFQPPILGKNPYPFESILRTGVSEIRDRNSEHTRAPTEQLWMPACTGVFAGQLLANGRTWSARAAEQSLRVNRGRLDSIPSHGKRRAAEILIPPQGLNLALVTSESSRTHQPHGTGMKCQVESSAG
jgi:hypothetical protein